MDRGEEFNQTNHWAHRERQDGAKTPDRQQKRLKELSQPQFYQTPFVSPQLELFELDEAE